jgi:hypothetical protein
MYTKPAVERFGTVRELTLVGLGGPGDVVPVLGISIGGCDLGDYVVPGCSSGS